MNSLFKLHRGKGFVPSLCSTTPAAGEECWEGFIHGSIRFVMGTLWGSLQAFCVGNATEALMRTLGPAALTPKVRELRVRETYIET